MIYYTFENLESYFQPGEALHAAICFARDKAAALPDGDHKLPNRMVARLMTYNTEPAEQRLFENHRRFIDVQVMLKGNECHDVAPGKTLAPVGEFNVEKDIGRFEAPGRFSSINLEPGWFVVYFPQDNHRPNCCVGGLEQVRKVCMKIPV